LGVYDEPDGLTGFRHGQNPLQFLSNTRAGRQMGSEWMQSNIQRMITGPHPLRTNALGWELGTQGYRRYLNVMGASGDRTLFGLVFLED
jgi:hypothetical protein